MKDFAGRYFQLNSAGDGETKRQALERQLDRAEIEGKIARIAELEAELAMPPFPDALTYLWQAYIRIRKRKGPTDMGTPRPIEWPDIDAFIDRSGVSLVPWEVEIIEQIDDLFVCREEPSKKADAARPMSEELFDALFA